MADPRLWIEGSVETDGGYVYIGGMDLANIIRSSMPSRPNPNNHQGWDIYPNVRVSVKIEALPDKDERGS